jgi:ABC-type Fe3+/spermidine/putrescine transport system ATPase subunit
MKILEVKGLTKRFGGLIAVHNVSFAVDEGEIFAVIGPNGAGKTTLFNLISGLLSVDGGEIFLKDKAVRNLKTHERCELGIGRTFQTPRIFGEMTVLDNFLIGGHSLTRSGVIAAGLRFPSVKREETSYSRMLKELKNASQKILDIIRESEKAEKEEPFATKNFSGLKGKLPWPVEGKIAIHYGSQKDPQFNTPIFRSGTYIQSNADSLAKAVHSGKVVFAEWFKGYGQLVIVNHGDGYHTLYGSLSEIFTKVGDIIKGKQAIGRVGNSGIVNSPGLYFELRYKGKPLDPLQWLHRR